MEERNYVVRKYVVDFVDVDGNKLNEDDTIFFDWMPMPQVGDVVSVARQSDHRVMSRKFTYCHYATSTEPHVRLTFKCEKST